MFGKMISLTIGYLFGCFLTAEPVARKYAGKGASEIGDTGNPGMANIMENLGFVPGMITLAGDLGKTVVAGLISYGLFRESGWIVALYSGLGCTIGHDFPFWRKFRGGKGVATSSLAFIMYSFPLGVFANRKFRGGKGVATTSMAIVFYAFLSGLAANIAGMLVVFATKYLCIGGPVIPLCFLLLMIIRGDREAAVLAGVFTALSVYAHGRAILDIREGKTKKTDVIGAILKRGDQ